MKAQSWLFVTDPWNTLDHANDTTLRLIEASVLQGIACFWCDVRSVRFADGEAWVDAHAFTSGGIARARKQGSLPKGTSKKLQVRRFHQIHYRVDPPVDLAYIHPLQLLAQSARERLVNPVESLLLFSEKTWAAEIPERFPETLVSAQEAPLLGFLRRKKQVVLKPLNQAQSKGVIKLSSSQPSHALEHLQAATDQFCRPIVLQEFLPEVAKKGETRLWFVDGRLIAAAQKVPAAGEFIINMDQGGFLEPRTLDATERQAARQIGALLKKNRIRLAAVDWISGKITDFNITSPGLIVAMEKTLEQDLATKIVRSLMTPR
ncbi:MAG: Glutathione synthetase [Pseudomonadota bacterium]|jgi:glutathione synthetase